MKKHPNSLISCYFAAFVKNLTTIQQNFSSIVFNNSVQWITIARASSFTSRTNLIRSKTAIFTICCRISNYKPWEKFNTKARRYSFANIKKLLSTPIKTLFIGAENVTSEDNKHGNEYFWAIALGNVVAQDIPKTQKSSQWSNTIKIQSSLLKMWRILSSIIIFLVPLMIPTFEFKRIPAIQELRHKITVRTAI